MAEDEDVNIDFSLKKKKVCERRSALEHHTRPFLPICGRSRALSAFPRWPCARTARDTRRCRYLSP